MYFTGTHESVDEQLKRLQHHLELTQKMARIGSWEWDIVTGANVWSNYFFTICGLELGAVKPSYDAFFRVLHPEDHEKVRLAVERTLEGKAPYDLQCRIIRADGSIVHVRSSGRLERDASDKPIRMTGTLLDISDLKKREAELVAVADAMNLAQDYGDVGSYSWRIEDDQADWSPGFWRLHELNPQSANACFQTWLNAVQPDDRDAAVAAITEAILDKTSFRHEYRVNKPGTPRWLICKGHVITSADGSAQRVVGMVTDSSITKQQRLSMAEESERLEELVLARTKELAAARDVADQASKAKSVILANISHELRTPLNHIIGFNSIIKKEITSKQGMQRMEKVMTSANRLLRLVNNLLDTAMLETQQMQLVGRDFTMDELLQEMHKRCADQLALKGLKFVTQVNLDEAQWIHGDFVHVLQVLDEVVDNAIKFSATGDIVLHASIQSIGAKLVNLRLEVQDQGIGISVEQQANMFQLFVQQDGSSTRRYGGMGLGLALCQRLVNLMAGEIGLKSELGKGTRVWIVVPMSLTERPDSHQSSELSLWEQALPIMQHLLEMLTAHDFEAAVIWEDIKHNCSHLLGNDAVPFELAIDSYDFDRAAKILKMVVDSKSSSH